VERRADEARGMLTRWAQIGVTTALERLLTTLSSVERLMPLADNVFVVTPESHVRSLPASLSWCIHGG
jgi:hypothetical protein